MQKMPEAPATSVVFVIDDDASVLRDQQSHSVHWFTGRSLRICIRVPGSPALEHYVLFNSRRSTAGSEWAGVSVGALPRPMLKSQLFSLRATVKAMKAGAIEFLTKPFRDQDLLDAIQVALEHARVKDEKDRAVSDLKNKVSTLTPREQEVMAWITGGLLNKPPPRLAPAAPPTPKPMPFQPFDRFRVKKPPANSTTIRRPSPPAHRQSLVGLSL